MTPIVEGAWLVPMGNANAVLLEDESGLTLVDAGFPGKEAVVFDAIRALGRAPGDLRHLVFTHGHPDHIGSAAAIVRHTGATTWMHPRDVSLAETGGPFRPMTRAPGLWSRVAFALFWRPNERVEPFRIDRRIEDNEVLPVAGGLQVIPTPGHCTGQVSLLWRGDRLLIVGDAGMNMFGLGDPIGFEDTAEGRRSQRRLASFRFKAAAFGHGKPMLDGASEQVRRQWG